MGSLVGDPYSETVNVRCLRDNVPGAFDAVALLVGHIKQ